MVAKEGGYFLLNAVRFLNTIAVLLFFASNIVAMVHDVESMNAFIVAGEANSNSCIAKGNSTVVDCVSTDTDYIDGSTVPNQPAGAFWAVLNRILIIFQVIVLAMSSVGWPAAFGDIQCLANIRREYLVCFISYATARTLWRYPRPRALGDLKNSTSSEEHLDGLHILDVVSSRIAVASLCCLKEVRFTLGCFFSRDADPICAPPIPLELVLQEVDVHVRGHLHRQSRVARQLADASGALASASVELPSSSTSFKKWRRGACGPRKRDRFHVAYDEDLNATRCAWDEDGEKVWSSVP